MATVHVDRIHDSDAVDVSSSRALLWILAAGIVVRVVLWFVWGSWSPLLNADAEDYHGLASRLATTGAYASERGELISLRPPLYPAINALIYCTAGVGNDGVVRVVQAVVSLLIALLAYWLALIIYSARVAIWAAGVTCFYPAFLAYGNVVLSETWFTFFALAVVTLTLDAVKRRNLWMLLVVGIALGLAALTRSVMLLFVPFLSLYLLWAWPGGIGRRFIAAAVPAVFFALVICPWAVRNTRLQQTFTLIDVMGGRNVMMGNYEHTPTERSWATISDVVGDQAWYVVLAKERGEKPAGTQGQLDKQALRHAIDYVLSHPITTLKRDAVKFFNFWQLERTFSAAASQNYFGAISTTTKIAIAIVFCGSCVAVMYAALFGICVVPPRDLRQHVFLLAAILFPCAIHSLIFAHERYRLPVMPLLIVYASAAIVDWRTVWGRRHTLGFRVAVGLCLLLTLGWLRELVMVDLRLIGTKVS